MMEPRAPWRMAIAVGLVVLAGYLVTLAPTVTFWDAGEFIAAARTLGIPHPPGTPFWVLLAHVWGRLVPVGDYAWRLNLLSAVCGAVAAGCWYLVVHASARRGGDDLPPWLAHGMAAAAALVAAFTFTTWQNAVEAEVYAVAMLGIALAAWLAIAWRGARTGDRGARLLLVILYLGALSIGNHLLALLAGPAIVGLLVTEARGRPLPDPVARQREMARLGVVAAAWVLLIALGLGSATLTVVAGLIALVAAAHAVRRGAGPFVAATAVVVVVGISTYLFLFLRAQQGPWINEADPSTWDALLAVIRRAQYPIRTPLDDPTVLHGPGNPGRSLALLGVQLANYAQYFDWQWARGLGERELPTLARLLVTGGALALGVTGAVRQRRTDPSGFVLVLLLFLVTGLGLVAYMNFKPGPSIGWSRWPGQGDHEVRERDYFFIASFTAWSLWVGLGLGALAARLRRGGTRVARLAPAVLLLALVPVVGNARDASRRHGADVTLARDFARALLASVPPGGILFTWGDNDTFPLWHAQAVDGVRTDVTIVCLALAETRWYQRQVREYRASLPTPDQLPAVWRDHPMPTTLGPVHTLTDAELDGFTPQRVGEAVDLPLPTGGRLTLPAGTVITGKDLILLRVVQEHVGRRPVAWALSAAHKLYGAPVIQQGLALVLPVGPVDTTTLVAGSAAGADGAPLDLVTTERLMTESWAFSPLLERGADGLEANVAAMAQTVALPFAQVGVAHLERGDTVAAVASLRTAARLMQDPAPLRALLAELGALP